VSYFESCNTIHLTTKVKFESQKYCSPSKQMPTEKFTLQMKVNTQAATFSCNIIYHGTLGLTLAAQECAVFW
jgi:hypothetical protein